MDTNHNAATVFKSLGNSTRLEIARKLARDGVAVNSKDIVSDCSIALKLSQPTMSHHFGDLVAAGVILEQKIGAEKWYEINQSLLESVGIDIKKFVREGEQGGKKERQKHRLSIWT